jgi:hypothetical protein
LSPGALRPRPARELALAAVFFLAVTVLMTWPQAAHMGDALSDVGDAKLVTRILQWDFAQTFRDPLDLYQLNFFHPARDVLAFSENLYGVAVFGFPVLAGGASPLFNYNLLLLAGMFLSAVSAWALAREVTGDPIASVLAGLVFAFVPWRFSQIPHLPFQWGGFLCLSLLFLLRYLDRGSRRDAALFGACFAWNALCNVHYALFSGFLVGLTLLLFAAGDVPERGRRLRGAILAAALGALAFAPFALPYREARQLYGMRRYLGETLVFSARLSDFLSAGARNRLYGVATERWARAEGDLFPGLVPVALAVLAVARLRRAGPASPAAPGRGPSPSRRRLARALDVLIALLAAAWIWSLAREGLRLGPLHLGDPGRVLVFLTLAAALRLAVAFPKRASNRDLADFVRRCSLDRRAILFLALGAAGVLIAFGARTPYYRFLFQSLGDVFRSIRVPARAIVLFHLALAVLSAWGLALVLRARPLRRRLAWTGAAAALVIFEYRAFPLALEPTEAAAPPVYAWLASFEVPGAVVECPLGLIYDFDYVFRQTAHGKPILNGYSGFFPKTYSGLEAELKRRPIPDSAWRTMGDLGASLLVYHSHEGRGFRVVGYADALDRALSEGRLELVRSFPHGTGRDFVFLSTAATWLDRARQAAAPPEETRRLYDSAVTELRHDVAILSPPVGNIHLPEEGQRVSPGFWVHGWAVDDSGVAEVRFSTDSGAAGVALAGGVWPGLAEVFPDYPEVKTSGSYGFALPELSPGSHTLSVTIVGKDGGTTTLRRSVDVTVGLTASPTPKGPGSR